MQASDIMSTAVFSVRPDMPVKDIAALLFEKRISGVPVLDEGRLVGIVSEGDLLQRHEIGTDLAAGGMIVLTATGFFVVALIISALRGRFVQRRTEAPAT